ncbi:MAG: BON domain-containing protein [Planctomycetales bacterium]|nr:BON domain-containing protein [Planctomycetales bacterium]
MTQNSANLLAQAKQNLRGQLRGHADRIRLTWMNGSLVLAGRLPTFYQKQLAQEAVRHIQGVRNVENQIAVD